MNLSALSANIKALDLSYKPATSEAEQDYFRFYGLNFEEKIPHISHHFGHLACGRFNIVSHYFENSHASETCFIVHGYFDHSGLYQHIIDYCLKRNFSVVIFDLPGHGLSTGKQACIENFSDYQMVLKNILDFFRDVAPKPWHAIGQSTGGAILMDFLLTENTIAPKNTFDEAQAIFDKTILLAPLIRPANWRMTKIRHLFGQLFFKKLPRKFAINSHDQKFLAFLKNSDPLQSKYLSVAWVGALIKWVSYFHQLLPTQLLPAQFAPLIIQGRNDQTVDWPYNITVIKKKFPEAAVFYVNEAGHQLVNETESFRQSIFSAMDIYFDT